eukprot:1458046-Ditylum_brightwellii.AAC.1
MVLSIFEDDVVAHHHHVVYKRYHHCMHSIGGTPDWMEEKRHFLRSHHFRIHFHHHCCLICHQHDTSISRSNEDSPQLRNLQQEN